HLLLVPALIAAPLPFLLAYQYRTENKLRVTEDLQPYVITPGDDLTINFTDHKLSSLGGRWSGSGSAEGVNWVEAGANAVKLTCQTDSWGDKVAVAGTLGMARDISIGNLSAQLDIPRDPALAGKTLKVRVGMSVIYPSAAGTRMDLSKGQLAETFENKKS